MTTAIHQECPNPRSYPITPVAELELSAPSRVENIRPMVERLIGFMRPVFDRCSEDFSFEVDVAAHEAIANAIIHGNDQDCEKRVYVHCRYTMNGELWIRVRDEGEGFDYGSIPDLTGPEGLALKSGRGIHIMRALMDEVAFEYNGRVVSMHKALRPSVARRAAPRHEALRIGRR